MVEYFYKLWEQDELEELLTNELKKKRKKPIPQTQKKKRKGKEIEETSLFRWSKKGGKIQVEVIAQEEEAKRVEKEEEPEPSIKKETESHDVNHEGVDFQDYLTPELKAALKPERLPGESDERPE